MILMRRIHTTPGQDPIIIQIQTGRGIVLPSCLEPVNHDLSAKDIHQVVVGAGLVEHVPLINISPSRITDILNVIENLYQG